LALLQPALALLQSQALSGVDNVRLKQLHTVSRRISRKAAS